MKRRRASPAKSPPSAGRIPALAVGTLLLLNACAGAPTKKVLVIGIDGVRPDVLAQVSTPNIDALAAEGQFVRIETKAQTISGPGWSSMLTGVWPDKHRVVSNDFNGNDYARYPDFLTRLEQADPGFATFSVTDWPPLGTSANGGPLLGDSIDEKRLFDGGAIGYPRADSLSVAAAIELIRDGDPDAAFVYIGNPDVVAHEHGGLSPEYFAAIAVADAQVGELIRAIRDRPTYSREDWLILVSTDHGHRDEGGHGGESPEERGVFYLVSGPSVAGAAGDLQPDLVDVAVTALAHLGVAADPDWGLDGKVAGLSAHAR
jgi:hypothetical protein